MASQGDPRVLFVMNFLLSGAFSAVVVWGLAFIGLSEFTLLNVTLATLTLMVITWAFVSR